MSDLPPAVVAHINQQGRNSITIVVPFGTRIPPDASLYDLKTGGLKRWGYDGLGRSVPPQAKTKQGLRRPKL
jgi:hypothetical protein